MPSGKDTQFPTDANKGIALLSIAGREKFDPISLETAAGVVARMRKTIKEVWNVDLRLVPTFSALPHEAKDSIAKYGEGTKAKGVLYNGHVYLVADEQDLRLRGDSDRATKQA